MWHHKACPVQVSRGSKIQNRFEEKALSWHTSDKVWANTFSLVMVMVSARCKYNIFKSIWDLWASIDRFYKLWGAILCFLFPLPGDNNSKSSSLKENAVLSAVKLHPTFHLHTD